MSGFNLLIFPIFWESNGSYQIGTFTFFPLKKKSINIINTEGTRGSSNRKKRDSVLYSAVTKQKPKSRYFSSLFSSYTLTLKERDDYRHSHALPPCLEAVFFDPMPQWWWLWFKNGTHCNTSLELMPPLLLLS